ncbi:MAG: acetyl-CoA carboxylase biotin carboxyl carrier protein subunit [Vicinamibacteria bacterium]
MSREKTLRSLPDGKLHSVRVERTEGGYRVDFGDSGSSATVERGSAPRGVWSVLTPSGASFEATVNREESELEVEVGHARFRFALGPAAEGRAARATSTGRVEVRSPMPGKVVRILVSTGQSVAAGEPVLLFEAMKMQNELRSPQDGVVAQISVEAGQAVEAREPLYVLGPPCS